MTISGLRRLRNENREGSIAELSSLGGLDIDTATLNLGPTTRPTSTSDAPLRTMVDAIDMHKALFPSEVKRLVEEAATNTDRLSAFFSITDLMQHETKMETHAKTCMLLSTCLKAFPGIALFPVDETDVYQPPPGSAWYAKRRDIEDSLLRNLRKYIRFSEHFVRKPPRYEEKVHVELNKFHAFADKFFDLSSKLSNSNERLRLMELVDSYERMKLDRLKKREERAIIRADRAARKLERELLRQKRDAELHAPVEIEIT
ncbi:hypothetical protein MIND_01382900 [Mycena indigotica]|uniref:Uncharacterized protein n=1 Tax=Mycena indigotica TaxID=2126181 RepID=A0A8H6VPE3_9AGAR|nr:uncharacterized protein MIND_01382900 [Mycena indigotica]KAF7289217.1 hypothetical protein MIND_01382900 [Mycena indigotica]